MVKGQWIKIISMEGEPQMAGKVGQYEDTDDMGQIHGTWGIALHPDTDTFVEITESEAIAIRAARSAALEPVRSGFGTGAACGDMMDGRSKVKVTARVDFTRNDKLVVGVREIDARKVYGIVESLTGIRNVAVDVRLEPLGVRKKYEDVAELVERAVANAMEKRN